MGSLTKVNHHKKQNLSTSPTFLVDWIIMICTYKIQCTQCQNNFECEVEIETTMTTYPVTCPRCSKQIELSMAKTKQLPSLPKSKTSHYISKTTKPETDESDDKITFRSIPQLAKHERKSKIIRPKQSRLSELSFETDSTEPVDFLTCPEPGPYTTVAEKELEVKSRRSRPPGQRKTRKRNPEVLGKSTKEEQIAPGYEWVPPRKRSTLDDSYEKPAKFEKPIKPKTKDRFFDISLSFRFNSE